jgi:hypothetical protein
VDECNIALFGSTVKGGWFLGFFREMWIICIDF